MSSTTALGVTPDRRPVELAEFRNSHGWAPSIWGRLLVHHGYAAEWYSNDQGLMWLWHNIETLDEWEQAALVLTFDTGVVPYQAFQWCAEGLREFERRLPSNPDHVNHVPAMADLLASTPEVPLFGVYGTSVSDNPFDPWDEEADDRGSGIPLSAMYLLPQHRSYPKISDES